MDPFQEIWKNSLLALPDRNFFDLVRNYLGRAETPYNKQKMIKGLEQFLAKPEVQERIASLVTPPEAAILSVVHFRQGASLEELASAFRDRYRPREFDAILRNLRERLLVFTVRDGGELKYMITPALKRILGDRVLHPLNIVSSHPVTEPAVERMYWLTDSFFMAFCSFCIHSEAELTPERSLRKRDINRFRDLFAGHLFYRDEKEILDLCLNAVLSSGVLRFEGGHFVPHLPSMRALAELTPVTRFYYLAACAATGLSALPAEEIYRMVRALHEGLPADREFPPESLIRILPLLSGSVPTVRHSVLTYLIDNFAALGIFLPGGGEGTFRRNTMPVELSPHGSLLTVMGNMEITVRPEIPFYPEIPLFLSLEQYDLYSRYGLNRDAVIRGLETGLETPVLAQVLTSVSGLEIPRAVELSLAEWERERNSLRLYRGVLMVVDKERLPVLEGTGILNPYVKLNPAPGVYLLDEFERESWGRVLVQAGFRVPDRLIDFKMASPSPLMLPEITVLGFGDQNGNGNEPLPVYDRKKLEETLQVKGLKPEQQEVLRERLDRKILFLPSQVTAESLRQEPMTARGIDYQGKINLVEAAISAGDILEVELADSDYNVHTEQIYPVKLDKEEGEWHVRGETRPAEEPFESRVSKLASVKRVRVALI
jgi:hypothetical protein